MAETLAEWVAEHPRVRTADTLADRAVKEVPHLCVQLIKEEVEHIWRHQARAEEQRVFRSRIVSLARSTGGEPSMVGESVTLTFPTGSFSLGDGTRVLWQQATVEQHRQRINILTAMRKGITDTIDRHEAAIEAIERAGAQCLAGLAAKEERSA